MSKELPYFKFYISEWIIGDITLEDYNVQGFFINVCAYYWSKDCEISLSNLHKKFRTDRELIENLIENDLIKIVNEMVIISFLIEQFESKEVQKITNRLNGLKGGRPKKEETEKKPNGLFFANPNETETITETKPKHNQYKVKESKEDKSKEDGDLTPKISSILSFFDFSIDNPYHSIQQKLVLSFLTVLKDHDYFFTQFEAYKKLKTKEPEFKHSLQNFLGKQSEQFQDGKWMDNNWVEKLKSFKHKKEEKHQDHFSLAERNRAKRLAEELKNKTQ